MPVLRTLTMVLLLWGSALAQLSPIPEWFLSGKNRISYQIGLDREVFYAGHASGRIHCLRDCDAFGTIMQSISAAEYAGRRMRFSAWVRAERGGKPRLWMRVDGEGNRLLAFDNMDKRANGGSFDWRQQAIVLDVPLSAVSINVGLILDSKGAAWMDDAVLEAVDWNTKLTGSQHVSLPRNQRIPLEQAPPPPAGETKSDTSSIFAGIADAQAKDPAHASSPNPRRLANGDFEMTQGAGRDR
jgi:hypothetical protein